MSKKTIILLFFSFLILTGCKPKRIDEDKFIKIYTDIIIMKDTTGISIDNVKKEVFQKYNTSDKEYQNTLNYYNEDPEKWEAFFDKAIAYLENQKNKK